MNACQLAHFYDDHLSQIWRDGSGNVFLEHGWLEQWWVSDGSNEPADPPVAVSVLGAGGAGIRWREEGNELVGHVSTRPNGCYRIPSSATDVLLVAAA